MNPTTLGKSLDRYLRFTDRVVQAYTPGESSSTAAEQASAVIALAKAGIKTELNRQKTADKAKRAGWAKAWLEAFLNNGIFKKLEALLLVIHERATVAASTVNSQEARYARNPS